MSPRRDRQLYVAMLIALSLSAIGAGCDSGHGGESRLPDTRGASDVPSVLDGSDTADQGGDTVGPSSDTADGLDVDGQRADTVLAQDAAVDMRPVDIAALSEPLGEPDRPATIVLPENYHPSVAWPIVVLLHGYAEYGDFKDLYFGLSALTTEKGFVAVIPDGTRDLTGLRFWNATPYCCGTGRGDVDDVSYLWSLVEEAQSRLAIDPDRVYFLGHSNGGFMTHRMACERGDGIAAVASLAGVTFSDESDCVGSGPVNILQIHGTADLVVNYGGSFLYPSVDETIDRWLARNGCVDDGVSGPDLDLVAGLPVETSTRVWSECDAGKQVALWTMAGAVHVPVLSDNFTTDVLDHLFAQRR